MRGKPLNQKMADLPKDRLTKSPPFTCVGVDVRAVHIEVIEEMTSSSFINAMRRFIAMRGAVSEFRSDRGTNFVGAASELNMNIVNVEDSSMRAFLEDKRIAWKFNPPHASHFGGSLERTIGIARRILDAMLMDTKHGKLTHEVLTTFMAEVMAIMNSRPLLPVSSDVEAPFILSPQMLLTQKTQEVPTEFKDLDVKDMYRSQWKMVKVMANTFWKRWKSEFLSTLQPRQKWLVSTDNLKEGDVVLLHDKESARTDWPVGVVNRIFPSNSDGLPIEDDLTPTMSTPQSMEQELTDTCEGVTTREHRTLSEKGLMFYQSRVDHLSAKLTRVGKDLDSLLNTTILFERTITSNVKGKQQALSIGVGEGVELSRDRGTRLPP
ncbi:uncharacterized protein [Magallana gigas]|uniref:uncharacterized protein n=1 Tax=Magallana gigas TaxID=29159 RepID=UPI0033421817